MRFCLILLLIVKMVGAVAATAHDSVFCSPQDITRAQERVKQAPWAREITDKLISDCDSLLSAPIQVPDKGGQWTHHYVCKQCGGRLEYKKGKHICPRCHIEYKGWPFDEVIATREHTRNIDAIRDLGAAHALTSNTRYAQRARELLLAYADRYTSFPIHDYKGTQIAKGARLFAQTLDESVRTLPLVWGYELVRASEVFSDTDRKHIEQDLLKQIAATIQRNPMGVSNWQSWHNAALTAIGYCVGDGALVNAALHGSDGFDFQMQHSVLKDGFWYEGSASYHCYALEALSWTALAAKTHGEDLWSNRQFRGMWDAPLDYTFPDGRFPAVNDSDSLELKTESEFYELAYAATNDPRYAAVAASGNRASLHALFWGADSLPSAEPPATQSRNFGGLGAVMLRAGKGKDQLVAHLDYGPHGGAHGHFDKLGVILFANGRVVAPDPGRLAYGAKLHTEWYKTTLAHNTLVVDQKNQDAAEGKLEYFRENDDATIARVSCDTAYPGVHLVRSLVLTPRYLLDVFAANSTSGTVHTYDLAWHLSGTQKLGLPVQNESAALGAESGYQVLKNMRKAQTDQDWWAEYELNSSKVRMTTLGAPGTKVYAADGLQDNPPVKCPLTIARRSGTLVFFVSLLQPVGGNGLCTIEAKDRSGGGLIGVKTPIGLERWVVTEAGVERGQ